ncbi:uncharacterized protein ACIBXB_008675 isoform 1-T1 [Morphnus guianensis]
MQRGPEAVYAKAQSDVSLPLCFRCKLSSGPCQQTNLPPAAVWVNGRSSVLSRDNDLWMCSVRNVFSAALGRNLGLHCCLRSAFLSALCHSCVQKQAVCPYLPNKKPGGLIAFSLAYPCSQNMRTHTCLKTTPKTQTCRWRPLAVPILWT